jgi:hypothetical protein
VREANLSNDDFFKLNEETQDAFFLFDERVDKYTDELRSKGARLKYLNEKLADQSLSIGEERSKLAEENAGLNTWFGNQLLESKQVFKKSLSRRVRRVCESLSILWADPSFRIYSYHSPYPRRSRAATTTSHQAVMLPRTKRPLRGTADVEVRSIDRDRTRADDVKELLWETLRGWTDVERFDDDQNWAAFHQELTTLNEYIDQSDALRYRLFEPSATKRSRQKPWRNIATNIAGIQPSAFGLPSFQCWLRT